MHYSLEVGRIIHYIQAETAEVSLYISSQFDNVILQRVLKAFKATDNAIEALSSWTIVIEDNVGDLVWKSKDTFQNNLHTFRNQIHNITSLLDVVNMYTSYSDVLTTWMIGAVKQERASSIWAEMVAFHMLIKSKSYLSFERDIGAYFYTHGNKHF